MKLIQSILILLKKTLFFLIGAQLTFCFLVAKKGYRFFILYFKALATDLLRVSNGLTSILWHIQSKNYVLNSILQHDNNPIKITFYAAVRRLNNPNCNLSGFFQSLIRNAANLDQIEVLLAIDKDDDISYFSQLQQKFGKNFKFKIFLSDVRHGYQKLHLYDRELFKHIAPTSRMLCDYSDDCKIIMKHFDKTLLEIDYHYPDNIYFIHTRDTQREKYLGDVSKDLLLLFWILQAKEPASYFPIFSRKILDIAQDYANTHDTHNQWSPIANTWVCDCYIDILATYVKRFGHDRITSFDMIKMNTQAVAAPHHRTVSEYDLTPNNLAFITLLNNETQHYLENLGKLIATHIEESTLTPILHSET